jgi:hypothetical protein
MSNAAQHWQGIEGSMSRIRVPGGWIYRMEQSGAAVFVPLDATQRDVTFPEVPVAVQRRLEEPER